MAETGDYYSQFDEDKNTDLHYAAAHNNIDEVKELLEKTYKIDSENCLGWTPLMMAARNGNLEIVKLLIDYKADATKKNAYGASVFLVSVASGDLPTVTFLLQHLLNGGVSRQSIEAVLSPYVIAVLFEHDHIIQVLLKNCFNINAATPMTGMTPIMFAASMRNEQRYGWLIANGADPTVTNVNNQSASSISLVKQWKRMSRGPQMNQQQHQDFQKHNRQQRTSTFNSQHSCHLHSSQNAGTQDSASFEHSDQHQHQHDQHQHDHHPQYPSPQFPQSSLPLIYISPQPTFINPLTPNDIHRMRKSSGFQVPFCVLSPSFSPIQPQYAFPPSQVFFPADFDPSSIPVSPTPNVISPDNSFLNHNFYQAHMSPFYGYNFPQQYGTNMESGSHHNM